MFQCSVSLPLSGRWGVRVRRRGFRVGNTTGLANDTASGIVSQVLMKPAIPGMMNKFCVWEHMSRVKESPALFRAGGLIVACLLLPVSCVVTGDE